MTGARVGAVRCYRQINTAPGACSGGPFFTSGRRRQTAVGGQEPAQGTDAQRRPDRWHSPAGQRAVLRSSYQACVADAASRPVQPARPCDLRALRAGAACLARPAACFATSTAAREVWPRVEQSVGGAASRARAGRGAYRAGGYRVYRLCPPGHVRVVRHQQYRRRECAVYVANQLHERLGQVQVQVFSRLVD